MLKGNSPCFDSGDPEHGNDPDGSRNDRGWQYLPHDAISGLEVAELEVRITEGDRVTESMLFTNTTEAPIYVTPLDIWREGPREAMMNLTNIFNDNDVQAAIKINNGYLVAGGNNGDDPNKIYRLDEEFNLQRTFDQPGGVDGDGFLDMAAFNDEIIFAGDEELIVEFTIDGELGEQYEGPDAIGAHRALGADVNYAENGLNLYLGGDEGYIVKTDDDFWEIGRTEVGDTIRGLGMKSNTRAAYIVTQPNQGQHVLSLVTPDDGRVAPLYELTPPRTEAIMGGFDITTKYHDDRGTMVGVWKGDERDDDWLFVTDLYTTWLSVYPQWHLLMPGDSARWDILFAGDVVSPAQYRTDFYLSVNGYGQENEITATMNVQTNSVGYGDELKFPGEFRLLSIAPNPFNSQANIKFFIPSQGYVSVSIFDSVGREVDILGQRVYQAGYHSATIAASGLKSGSYFIRAESRGNSTAVESIVLIK